MSSRGKSKPTFAKMQRETRLRERRMEKAARKEERRLNPDAFTESESDLQFARPDFDQAAVDAAMSQVVERGDRQ